PHPASYRPINCINIYCKIFERVLFNRLQTRIESKLCKQQHGCRSNHSCQTALAEFTNYIYSALDQNNANNYVVAIYYDARSASDSLDRSLLIKKLMSQFNLHPVYISTIYNYIDDRVFKFKGDDHYYSNQTGVIQGASGSGMFYAAYQNDISDVIDTPFLLYVDDLVIYLAGQNLEDILKYIADQANLVQKWYTDNNMSINYSKTKYQIFRK